MINLLKDKKKEKKKHIYLTTLCCDAKQLKPDAWSLFFSSNCKFSVWFRFCAVNIFRMDWTCAQVTRLLFGVRLYHRGKLPNAVKCCQTCRALEQLVWVCVCVLIGALSQSTANGLLRSSNLIFWASKSENSLWERSCVCSVFQQKVQRAMQRYRSAPSSIDSKWLGFPSNICVSHRARLALKALACFIITWPYPWSCPYHSELVFRTKIQTHRAIFHPRALWHLSLCFP